MPGPFTGPNPSANVPLGGLYEGVNRTPTPGNQVYVLRTPQVTAAPARSQIGSADIFLNLLMTTLAVTATVTLPTGRQWFSSAPQAQYQTQVDTVPNLLGTTLAVQSVTLPPGRQWFVSAPEIRRVGTIDLYPDNRVLNQLPPILRADASAPVGRQVPTADIYQNLLRTTLTPLQPPGDQWSGSAPMRVSIGLDSFPNLSNTTLVVTVVQNPFTPLDTSQWQGKYNLEADVVQRPITLTQTPPVVRHDYPAPQAKWNFFEDKYQNLLSTTLKPVPFRPVDTSQWLTRYNVESDAPPRNITLNQLPPVQQLQGGSQSKYAVEVDLNPNLVIRQQQNVPIQLPLGLPFDSHGPLVKFQVQADQFVNMLIIGYPVPPPVTGLPQVVNIGLAFGPFGKL